MNKEKWFEKALAEGFESFEIYQDMTEERSFTWFEGQLDTYVVSHVLGTAFRGVTGGKMVNASSEDTGDSQMDDIISSMKQQASMISSEDKARLRRPEQIEPKEKKQPASFDAAKIREFLKKAEEKILAYDERIFQVTDLEYEENRQKRTIVNTYGMDLADEAGINVLVAGAAAKQGEEVRNAYEFEPVENPDTFDLDAFVSKLADKVTGRLGAGIPESGNVSVLIDREAMTSLFRAFSPMFCGDQIRKGISPLSDRLNEKVFSDLITIIDDPACQQAYTNCQFDDEGCPVKRKTVVDHGVFRTILHSTASADAMNCESSGNGFRRSYDSPVDSVPRNFWIEPGEKTPQELMKEMGDGIMITEFAGLHAGLRQVTGDFSLQCGGYRIKDGKRAEGLTLFTAAGNFLELLSDVKAVANDLEWGVSSTVTPSILVGSLAVSGR